MSKYQNSKRTYPITRNLDPENQETPIHFLRSWITPSNLFFIRNHFPYPSLSQDAYLLPVEGAVNRPLIFQYEQLKMMPSVTLVIPLECSGNQRERFEPDVYGDQWRDGAISQGIWKGVSLSCLLTAVQMQSSAMEVVFEAYDEGERTDIEGIYSYARSLPLEKALHSDTIIAYELNGAPIPFEQGYPLRLIVPSWYAMASVKWLKRITVIDHHFKGPFQEIDYNYYPNKDNDEGKTPVTNINVNSIIQQPTDLSIHDTGTHQIDGIAWTGTGLINSVEISTDGGVNWNEAELFQDHLQPYAWTFWQYHWTVNEPGEYLIISRAIDSFGNIQPEKAFWNRKGYGYNATYKIRVKVE